MQLHAIPCPHDYLSYFDLLLYQQAVPRILDSHIEQLFVAVWTDGCPETGKVWIQNRSFTGLTLKCAYMPALPLHFPKRDSTLKIQSCWPCISHNRRWRGWMGIYPPPPPRLLCGTNAQHGTKQSVKTLAMCDKLTIGLQNSVYLLE